MSQEAQISPTSSDILGHLSFPCGMEKAKHIFRPSKIIIIRSGMYHRQAVTVEYDDQLCCAAYRDL